MSDIIVFGSEKEAGLEKLIKEQSSLAYVSQLCPAYPEIQNSELDKLIFSAHRLNNTHSQADHQDGDVYQTFSILVSASWNKNDDVFNKSEVWAAQNTPKYKPANLEHDEKQIVGGIIGSWPVDSSFSLIDKNTREHELPDFYHLLVSSVIYKQWQDPEYQARAEDLISKIENGQMFVSMECIFRGFDYAVVTPDNNNHIIARNEETSFLTRHLRAYGGSGGYEDHKVGRLLRNITFSGKGYVEKPANPDSIIFDSNHIFDFSNASVSKNPFSSSNGVSVRIEEELFSSKERQENFNMSTDILNNQVNELKQALADVQAENKELSEKLSKANVEVWDNQISELTEQVKTLEESLCKANEDLQAEVSKSEGLESKIEEETGARTKAEDSIKSMLKEKAKAERMTALIEAGLSEEEATAKIEIFDGLSDEQFTAMAETLKSAYNTKKMASDNEEDAKDSEAAEAAEAVESEPENHEEEEAEASEVDEEVLETASVEETIDMSVASEDTEEESENVRANLREWVNTYVLNQELGE